MYKIRPEISSFGPLAPRHYMTQHSFKKLTSDRIKKLGSKFCEACNEKTGLIDLHESFSIQSFCYTFDGFYFLCRQCHMGLVHFIQCYHINTTETQLIELWRRKENLRKFSEFKNEKEFVSYGLSAISNVVDFILSDEIKVNYTAVKNHGLSETEMTAGFIDKYNHFDSRIRYLLNVGDLLLSSKMKKFNSIQKRLFDEYLKHQSFLKEVRKLPACDLREQKIKLYAATMTLEYKNNKWQTLKG